MNSCLKEALAAAWFFRLSNMLKIAHNRNFQVQEEGQGIIECIG
jgi:hypothetical protein